MWSLSARSLPAYDDPANIDVFRLVDGKRNRIGNGLRWNCNLTETVHAPLRERIGNGIRERGLRDTW
jgi:hypothetical protein